MARIVRPGQSLSSWATTPADCGDLLEVVEHDQHPPLPQSIDELVLQRPVDDLAQADGPRDRHQDRVRVVGAGQVDERHAVAEPRRQVRGDADRERRLAGAPGPDEREQADGPVGEAAR